MKKGWILCLVFLCLLTSFVAATPFSARWDTEKLGGTSSPTQTIVLPIKGTYSVDWGDGTSNTSVNNHTYASAGNYTINITNINETQFRFGNNGDKLKIININQWGDIYFGNKGSYFYGCANLNSTATDNINFSLMGIDDTSNMFADALVFNGNISGWDVGNIQYMQGMFRNANTFNQDISGWDTGNVNLMNYMFNDAWMFNQPIGSWNTSSVTDMTYMFGNAFAFNQDISGWDTSSVITMENMFLGTTSFNQSINAWDTSKVTDMGGMFYFATAFNQPLNLWNTSNAIVISGMFADSNFNQDISGWNTSSATSMYLMFAYDPAFNQDISGWDTSSVTSMAYMFRHATAFDQNLSSWDINNVGDMQLMFDGDNLSTSNYDSILLGWSNQSPKYWVVFNAGDSIYSSAGHVGRNILTDTYNWTITDGGGDCSPDWVCSGYSSCLLNDTQACDDVNDNNLCNKSYTGNYSEFGDQPCDYCTPSWTITSSCLSNSTELRTYSDSNDCYNITGLYTDLCNYFYGDCDQWIACVYLANDMDCGYDVNPLINVLGNKIYWKCSIANSTGNYSCISYIKEQGAIIQTNPQQQTFSSGLLSRQQETRDFFIANNGLVNPYFTTENLVTNKTYVFGVQCSYANGTLQTEEYITPMYRNLEGVAYTGIWLRDNIGYIMGGIIILLILIAVVMLVVRSR